MSCKLTGLSSLETYDYSDATYKTIMFSHTNFFSFSLIYLKIVHILFVIKIMLIDRHIFLHPSFMKQKAFWIISLLIRMYSCDSGLNLNRIS